MKAIAFLLLICSLPSCMYYGEYGVGTYYTYPTTRVYSAPRPTYYETNYSSNVYRRVYAPINCENGLNQYEELRIYPNRDGRPFNLKYDHYY